MISAGSCDARLYILMAVCLSAPLPLYLPVSDSVWPETFDIALITRRARVSWLTRESNVLAPESLSLALAYRRISAAVHLPQLHNSRLNRGSSTTTVQMFFISEHRNGSYTVRMSSSRCLVIYDIKTIAKTIPVYSIQEQSRHLSHARTRS